MRPVLVPEGSLDTPSPPDPESGITVVEVCTVVTLVFVGGTGGTEGVIETVGWPGRGSMLMVVGSGLGLGLGLTGVGIGGIPGCCGARFLWGRRNDCGELFFGSRAIAGGGICAVCVVEEWTAVCRLL